MRGRRRRDRPPSRSGGARWRRRRPGPAPGPPSACASRPGGGRGPRRRPPPACTPPRRVARRRGPRRTPRRRGRERRRVDVPWPASSRIAPRPPIGRPDDVRTVVPLPGPVCEMLNRSVMASPSTLRAQALFEFELPAAPQRVDELPSGPPRVWVQRVHAPAGRFLLICAEGALAIAFEATLFDLLAESRYPAPRPRRARGGALIARLEREGGHAGASCYALGSGEQLDPARATTPQFLEIGRLLARLHQIGEAHPASVPPGLSCAELAGRLPRAEAERLEPALRTDLSSLPA